uniref:Uncharacterized protein n=1 Tax=Hildenbrandia rivularis TaxID=135206 RepID=A0A1C9CFJ6_9FLOR|nr:hypothetical protein Hrvl_089 [Hildenbrandia rivularis]AOM67149.1 hypothetical protein Hrvl_089 [Hildenbrandia rivularis]
MLPFFYCNFTNVLVSNKSIHNSFLLTKVLEANSSIVKSQHSFTNKDIAELVGSENNWHVKSCLMKNKTFKKLLRRYWSEYVYISVYNPDSNNFEEVASRNYLLQSNYVGSNHRNRLDLKKYLTEKKIVVFYSNAFSYLSDGLSIKYCSKQYVNKLFTTLTKLYLNRGQTHFLRKLSGSIVEKLREQKLPVFVLVNGFGEMVVGEPEHTLHIHKGFLDNFLKLDNKARIAQTSYQLPLREVYMFLNPLDAIEYYNYLKSEYLYSSNELHLKIFLGTVKDYYEKSNLSISNTQFRLFPDLSEVGKLVKTYQYNSNIHFNPKQMYGKNYFQGQPIYFINPVLCTHINKLTGKIDKRYFPNLLTLDKQHYYRAFTNYEDAVSMWTQYRMRFQEYYLPQFPQITIYNLESFLEEHKNRDVSFRFVPCYEAYRYVKNLDYTQDSRFLSMINIKLIVLVKVWINRLLWGMLRWYPPVQ